MDHRLRIGSKQNLPTGLRAVLTSLPADWRTLVPPHHPDPMRYFFTHARRWSQGTLGSFKSLGAIGIGPGMVIYPDSVYKRYFPRKC